MRKASSTPSRTQPNILLVLTDQQRLDTLGGLDSPFGARTPIMDSLAERGAFFTQCCCTAPICGPSRASLLTGLHPGVVGFSENLHDRSPPLSRAHPTLGDRLQAAGYETLYHGKWHLGGDPGQYGFEHAEESSYDEDTRRLAARYWRDRDWLAYHRPFFHVVSFLDPHDIYFYDPEQLVVDFKRPWANTGSAGGVLPPIPAAKQVEWSEARWGAYHRYYAERLERVDAEIGRLLGELKCSGFYPDTWIIFCSDHGDMAGEHDLPFKGPFMYEGVIRVPLIVIPPQCRIGGKDREGRFAHDLSPSVQTGLCSLLDVPATVLDLAGVDPPGEWEGVSLLPWVGQEKGCDVHSCVIASWGNPEVLMARSSEWKLVRYADGVETLFNLVDDPAETTNRLGDGNAALQRDALRAELRKYQDKLNIDPCL